MLSSEAMIEQEDIACRTLVRVVLREGGFLRVLVPSWSLHETVPLPISALPPGLQRAVVTGTMLFAYVNTGAERNEDLRFSRFELAPDPLTEEEIDSIRGGD